MGSAAWSSQYSQSGASQFGNHLNGGFTQVISNAGGMNSGFLTKGPHPYPQSQHFITDTDKRNP